MTLSFLLQQIKRESRFTFLSSLNFFMGYLCNFFKKTGNGFAIQ